MNSLRRALRVIIEDIKDAFEVSPSLLLRHVANWRRKELSVNLSDGSTFHIRPHSSDALTIRQVFRRREYDLAHFPQWPSVLDAYRTISSSGKTPVIIDAGANIGAASVWFTRLFPEATIVAIEPDPQNASQCRKNTASFKQISLMECAIGATDGAVGLNNPTNEAWAVQSNRLSNGEGGVPICTIPGILAGIPNGELFIVKIDVEGFESDLFSENIAWVSDAKVIYIEPHDWMPTTRGSSRSFQQALAPHGREILICGENLVYVK